MHRTLDGVARCRSNRAKESGLFASHWARRWTLGITVLAIALSSGAVGAHAKPFPLGVCDTWTNTAGGDWNTGSNWSLGVPPNALTDACITQSGTYTVTITGESASANTLTVTGGPTVSIQATDFCGGSNNASLTLSNGGTIDSLSQLTLTHTGACGGGTPSLVVSGGTLSSSGTITMDPGTSDNNRYLQGSVTNTGTLAINAKTVINAAGTLDNEGSLTVASGESLGVSSGAGATVKNDTGGSISNGGSTGYVYLDNGNTFVQGAGTTNPSGVNPTSPAVYVHNSNLQYTGGGQSSIVLRGSEGLSGDVGAKQALTIQATDFCSGAENATVTAASSFTSSGQIMLTHAGGCGGGTPTLAMTGGGTLSSSGTITMDPGTSDNNRYLQGSVTNTGTLAINAKTVINAAGTLDNEGSLTVASGESLGVSSGAGATVKNDTGGSISNASGTGYVYVDNGNTFVQGAGTTNPSGVNPTSPAVYVHNSNLQYTGGGQSSIVLRGSGGLSGSPAAGQALTIQATDFCSGAENATATASSSFTNAGQIMLTHTGACGGGTPSLVVSGGTLSSSGTITMDPGTSDNNRYLQGSVTNTGTLAINAKTVINAAGTLDNEGSLTVASGESLGVSSGAGATVKNDTGGSISNGGSTGYVYLDNGNTFVQGAGTTNPSGVNPTSPAVYVHNSNLQYTGGGQSSIVLRGSEGLSGDVGAKQALTIQATDFCSGAENATVTAASSFTSSGQIMLTHAGGCGGGTPTLAMTGGGTLSSSGTITMDPGTSDNNRYLQGSVTNTGTLAINAKTVINAAGTLDNEGSLTVASGESLGVSSGAGATVKNDTGGSIDNGGSTGYVYLDNGNTFVQGAGTTNPSGVNPTSPAVYVHNSNLQYTGGGQSSIVLRGSGGLSGSPAAGQALTIQATDFCSGAENATATASSSFTNAGQIMLTHTGACGGGTPSLTLTGGGTLQNTGAISVSGSPQTPQLNTNLDNEGTVFLGQVASLTGNYTQGAYAFLEPAVSGTGSGQYGQLAGAQNLTLNGTLIMNPSSGYASSATVGDTIPVITYSGTQTGAFCDAGSNPPLSGGNSFVPDYSHPGVVNAVVSSTAASDTCPPPPTQPSAATDPPTSVTTTSAVLHGTVNPGNAPTTYHFEYGTTKAYGQQIPTPDGTVGSDGNNHAETQSLSGLTPNKKYHYRIVATNSLGTVQGKDETFTTSAVPPPPSAPAASTDPATDVTDSAATLHGTVNPEGSPTTYHFEYGTTKAYGQQIPSPDGSVGSDSNDHPEAQSPSGLTPNTTYHYRIVATNAQGTTSGADEKFTTALPPPVAGVSVNLFLTAGVVYVTEPGSSHRRRLRRPEQVRIGSLLDTTRGEVEIEAARTSAPGQPPEYARFYDGIFQILQRASVHAIAEARLRGGNLSCLAASSPARPQRPTAAPAAAAILLPLTGAEMLDHAPALAASGTLGIIFVAGALAVALVLVLVGGGPRRILTRAVRRPVFLVAVFALGGIATAGVWLAVSPSSGPRGHATLQLGRPGGGSRSHGGNVAVAAAPHQHGSHPAGKSSAPGGSGTPATHAPSHSSGTAPRSSNHGATPPSTPPSHGHNPPGPPGHNHKPPSPGTGSRSLWTATQGPGNWRTEGTYASATVRGTQWLTKDECTGTLVQVVHGAVVVFDFTHAKSVVLTSGQSYFASR